MFLFPVYQFYTTIVTKVFVNILSPTFTENIKCCVLFLCYYNIVNLLLVEQKCLNQYPSQSVKVSRFQHMTGGGDLDSNMELISITVQVFLPIKSLSHDIAENFLKVTIITNYNNLSHWNIYLKLFFFFFYLCQETHITGLFT